MHAKEIDEIFLKKHEHCNNILWKMYNALDKGDDNFKQTLEMMKRYIKQVIPVEEKNIYEAFLEQYPMSTGVIEKLKQDHSMFISLYNSMILALDRNELNQVKNLLEKFIGLYSMHAIMEYQKVIKKLEGREDLIKLYIEALENYLLQEAST